MRILPINCLLSKKSELTSFTDTNFYNSLPRHLNTREKRMRALQFFTQQPRYIKNCPECYKMLLLLFCECEEPHCELTIDVLEHLIPHITRPDSLFKSLVVSLLNCNQHIGIQFCYNLWFYWSLSQGKADLLLCEVLKDALQSSSIAARDK